MGDSGEFHASITDLLSGLWHPAYPALRPACPIASKCSCQLHDVTKLIAGGAVTCSFKSTLSHKHPNYVN